MSAFDPAGETAVDEEKVEVRALHRGGLWIRTPAGPVQFGAPSETLKDTLRDPEGVPQVYILGKDLFDRRRGVSVADVEFPIYYQLFVKGRPLRVVTTEEQGRRVMGAVKEALLGPDELLLEQDFAPGFRRPDLRREYEHFRKGPYATGRLELDDAIEVVPLVGGRASLGAGVELVEEAEGFSLWWGGRRRVALPAEVPLPPRPEIVHGARPAFEPPRFGVTTLGRSHGFDPDPAERTSGFVLWIGGRGVMVDPPVYSTDLLEAAEIDEKLIGAVLLTHCHADHDAGTLQKALEGGRTALYTTPTIFASYRRKMSLITGIPEAEIERLFDFRPVQVGAPVELEGAQFLFRYTLHSIPTIGFEAHYRGRSFSYSSDTMNDPAHIEAIYAQGGMEEARREELLDFDWGHDLIFHESGVPPLHTPLELFVELPRDVKRRLRLVHVSPSRVPPSSRLMVARPGREGTVALNVEATPREEVIRALSLLSRVKLFAELPLSRAADLLEAAKVERFSDGERFIREGEAGDRLYVISAGKAAIVQGGRELKVYGVGDWLGETAVFLGKPRTADVYAKTDLEVIAIDGDRCREICKGSGVSARVRRHARVRDLDAWSLFEETKVFSGMTVAQRTELEALLAPRSWQPGAHLARGGTSAREIVLISTGRARAGDGGRLGRGDLVGDPAIVLGGGRHAHDVVAEGEVRGFRLARKDFERFLDENPGVRLRVQPWRAAQRDDHEPSSLVELLEELL